MQLGTLIDHLSREEDAAVALEALGDIVLFSEVQAVGERYGESPGEYVANAARRFAALASDEDWLSLMSALERSQVPAHATLERMLRWALDADAREASPQAQAGCACGQHTHSAST